MLLAPGYWLAPCLVALAAWINDQPDVADRALREGINRNDEKTSLLFLLICRRAGRMAALSKWTKRYLENQDEKELDKKAVIIIDAYASGLLGADSEGLIYAHMQEWLKRLYGNVGFIVKQRQFWKESIESKRCPYTSDVYQYLREYSPTWDQLNESMGDTSIHSQVLKNFKDVFDKKDDNYKLKVKLDEILNTLVTDFDEEELPLKMEEVYNKYIIDFEGDVEFADRLIANDKKAVEETKNFAQILTDAAMYPETSHASAATQKFAIALSKEWIMEAYQDTVAQNRMRIPREIEIVVDEFNLTTVDGKNEELILERLNKEIDAMKEKTLSGIPLPSKAGVIGCSIVGTVGMMGLLVNDVSIFIAFIFLITGIAVGIGISYSAEKEYNVACAKTEKQFEIKREKVSETVKACMAEVVDFREEFEKRDSQSKKVVDFLEQISPQQYVRKLADSVRRIKVK